MSTRVRSFCKINLGLAVGPPRADGFHGLATLYQTLALHDFVTVSARRAPVTRITLTADHPGVPTNETNTAWKMVAAALASVGQCAEVEIAIEKRLPVQGGMGAGSANAVAALLGLERELGLSLHKPSRLTLAALVGSDVPLFLLGGLVLGLGRGEHVFPMPDFPPTHCVVAVPRVGVSTRLAFAQLDQRKYRSLTPDPLEGRLNELSRAFASAWTADGVEPGPSGIASRTGDLAENPLLALVRTGIENDFEEVAFSQHPSLRSTKRDLVGVAPGVSGSALYAALSGSGSALFGLYSSLDDARAAQQRVQHNGTEAILTETLPRPEYWKRMFA